MSDFVILSIGHAVSVVLSAVCMVYANHVLTEEPLTVGGSIKTGAQQSIDRWVNAQA